MEWSTVFGIEKLDTVSFFVVIWRVKQSAASGVLQPVEHLDRHDSIAAVPGGVLLGYVNNPGPLGDECLPTAVLRNPDIDLLSDVQMPQNIGLVLDQKAGTVPGDILQLEAIHREATDADSRLADLIGYLCVSHLHFP